MSVTNVKPIIIGPFSSIEFCQEDGSDLGLREDEKKYLRDSQWCKACGHLAIFHDTEYGCRICDCYVDYKRWHKYMVRGERPKEEKGVREG